MFVLKLVHTMIFATASLAILYMIWCGLRGVENRLLHLSMLLVAGIAVSLVLNGCVCPLQTLARHMAGTPDQWVSDIFLPEAVADLVVPVTTPLALFGFALVAWQRLRRRPAPGA